MKNKWTFNQIKINLLHEAQMKTLELSYIFGHIILRLSSLEKTLCTKELKGKEDDKPQDATENRRLEHRII